MEVFLQLNGGLLVATVDEQEQVILALAAAEMDRDELLEGLERHAYLPGQ